MNKRYIFQQNIGLTKYIVNYHDGKKKHKDGSDFYDVAIFSNKKHLKNFINTLKKEGYTE